MDERRESNIEMRVFMASAKDKLDGIHSDIVALNAKVGIQNGRIFKLEKWQSFVFGGCAFMGVLMTLASVISMWLKH